MKRVVITGMGIVSPVGTGIEYAWKNILAGKSGIQKISHIDVSDMTSQIGGVPSVGTGEGECNFDLIADAKEQRKNDKSVLYAMVAANEAVNDAGLIDSETGKLKSNIDAERAGVSIGGGIGGLQTIYDSCIDLYTSGPRTVNPFFIPKALINMQAGQVSIKHGLKGPNVSIVTACATGTHSIGEGTRLIQHGDADIMVCGGAEAAVCRLGIAGFCAMKALSSHFNETPEQASRPWDKNRDGFVISEGSGILVLEEYEHAVARGAKIYAEIAGYGMSGDAHHITAPAPGGEGGFRAMRSALKDAGINPSDIDYINAHGTSTGLGDIGEFTAVKNLFGDLPFSMSSTKSMTGHLLGAAGAIEAIFCVLAIRDQIVPPTINLQDREEITEGVDLPTTAKKRKIETCLNNSFGFGGTNASVVIKQVK